METSDVLCHQVWTPAGKHCMTAWTDFTQYGHLQWSIACLHELTSPSVHTRRHELTSHSMHICREALHACMNWLHSVWTHAGKHCMPAWTDFAQYEHLQGSTACLHELTSPSMYTCRGALHACMNWLHPVCTLAGKHCMPAWTDFIAVVNTWKLGQNGCHFANNVF